jgi:hypothetical protein
MQWTSVPDRVRYVPGVVGAIADFLPDELLEEYAAGRDPAMVAVGREAVAVAERPVMHDDPADAAPRPRCEV